MKISLDQPEKMRILITSDVHYSDHKSWYGVSSADRVQLWVNAIREENSRERLDGIIFAGDASLDHYLMQGSYTSEGISSTDLFVKKFVSQLPKGIPILLGPGNHELYSNEQWKGYTGQNRQESVVIGDQLFILLDTFCTALEPNFDGQLARYTPVDVSYVKKQMQRYPGTRVWLVAHYFDAANETPEFRKLVREESRITALFAGHSHQSSVVSLNAEYGNKVIAQTGNFSYSYFTPFPSGNQQDLLDSFWGFRDLVITNRGAESHYILAKNNLARVNGQPLCMERHEVHTVKFQF